MNLDGISQHLLMFNGKTCTKNGAEEVSVTIRRELKNLELQKESHTTNTLCNGQCKHGPIAVLYPHGIWYKKMNKTKSEEEKIRYKIHVSHVDLYKKSVDNY